jgi:hypothetical protein
MNLLAGRTDLLRDIHIFRFLLAIALSTQSSARNEDSRADALHVENLPVAILDKTDLEQCRVT